MMKIKGFPGLLLILAIFALGLSCTFMEGCATIDPGADKLIVRVEQAQAGLQSGFDLPLQVDNAQRDFWRAEAPLFHKFCEDLRQPVTYNSPEHGATNIPRVLMLQFQLDDLKQEYKAHKATSNDLYTALLTATDALRKAAAWTSVLTNYNHGH